MRRLLQLTLDLFDAAPSQPPIQPRDAAPAPHTQRPGDAPAPAPEAPRTPLPVGSDHPVALQQLLDPAAFTHPRANRQCLLAGVHIAYELRRGRRRSIGFVVGPEGLTVSAPRWVGLNEIDAALHGKAAWVVRKLREQREQRERSEAGRIEWRDGASFPFLGESVIVVLDPRRGTGAVLNTDGQALPGVPRLTLHVGLPQQASAAQVRDAVQAWLMRQATRVFTERLEHYAPRLGVRWTRLALSSASTRWGLARADGSIRLNWRLIHFRMPVIDYVVAHELSHLRVMDHSPRFWQTVGTVMPDYAQLRAQLRADPLPPW